MLPPFLPPEAMREGNCETPGKLRRAMKGKIVYVRSRNSRGIATTNEESTEVINRNFENFRHCPSAKTDQTKNMSSKFSQSSKFSKLHPILFPFFLRCIVQSGPVGFPLFPTSNRYNVVTNPQGKETQGLSSPPPLIKMSHPPPHSLFPSSDSSLRRTNEKLSIVNSVREVGNSTKNETKSSGRFPRKEIVYILVMV